jgi:gliding motility-associated-like protein
VWNYADCEGNNHDWTYTFTIEYEDFTMPADAGETVACASGLYTPTPPVVNDYCGNPITPTGPTVSATPPCEGDVTYVWNYADCEGNNHDWTYTFTIEYEDFTMPADAGETVACAGDLYTPAPPAVNDYCGLPITPTGPVVSATPPCEGDVTYVWNYADCEGNNHDWTYTFTIEYEDFTMPADAGETVACAGDLYTPAPPAVNDYCGLPITPTGPSVSATPPCEGIVTYVWKYADCEGNNHYWTYTFKIEYEDFTMPADAGETVECYEDITEPPPPDVYDHCGTLLIPTGPVITSIFDGCEGTRDYTWTFTDCEGNSHAWTYTFIIKDETPPVIECPGPLTAVCSGTQQNPYENFAEFVSSGGSASDNCNLVDESFILLSETSNGLSCPETITRVYQIADACGNMATCSQLITIDDNIPPVISCPADTVVIAWNDIPPPLTTLQAFIEAGGAVGDNCGIAEFDYVGEEEIIIGLCPRKIVRTYMVSDSCGNTATCQHTIFQDDDISPEVTCPPPINVVCAVDIPAPWTTLQEFIDAGGTVTDDDVTKEFNFLGQFVTGNCPRVITRTYQVVDSCENQTTCQHTIVQLDNVAPVLTCPDTLAYQCFNLIEEPYQNLQEFLAAGGSAFDNCGLYSFSWISDSSDYNECPAFVYRKYQVTDSCDNVAWCNQVIMVNDDIPPVITCPGSLTAVCSASEIPPYINLFEFQEAGGDASDNCGLNETTFILLSDEGDGMICPQTVTRTYQIADLCGNTATCQQQIVIYDDIPPEITCPPDTSVFAEEDIPQPLVSLAQFLSAGGTGDDNCGIAGFDYLGEEEIIIGLCPKKIIRTYMVSDSCGNTATCQHTILQNDDTPPEISCPPDANAICVGEIPGPYYTLEEFYEAGGTIIDDDPPKEFHYLGQQVSGTCPRTITRTYQVLDSCDNQAICEQIIIQADHVPPTVGCPPSMSFPCYELIPEPYRNIIEFQDAGGSAYDNCGIRDFTWVSDSSDNQTCPATVYRRYEVTDSCDNIGWCHQMITVNDQVPPVIACPTEGIAATCLDEVEAPDLSQVVATDNCGTAQVSWEDFVSDSLCVHQLEITRVFTATDLCGNTATCSQTITVFDDVPPVIICPDSAEVVCDAPPPDLSQVTAFDNCGTATVSWVEDLVDSTLLNAIQVTRIYMATDECGNTATCSTTISVYDMFPPTIVCPPDTTVYTGGKECDRHINIDVPEVFDDCGIESLVNDYTFTENASATYPIGVTVVTWTVTDNSGNTASCSMVVTVISFVDAIDDYATTNMNTPVNIDVVLNDIYCIETIDMGIFNILQPTLFGTLSLTSTFGLVTYNPYPGYHGFDMFVYEICDTLGNCDSAVVLITVLEAINHPPVAIDDHSATEFYLPVTIRILYNDYDPDGDSISLVSILSPPENGQLETNEDQTVTYTPNPGFMGVDVFSYLIRDYGYPTLFDSANVFIQVPATPFEEIPLKIYNTLTPNADGDNDYWKILNIEYFPKNNVVLMDRWGEVIHTYKGYNNGNVRWEGLDEAGRMLRNGVFFYILELHDVNRTYKGWVMLHR